MAWNFRRRIKILPGVHLNVGKKGVSTTFGVRGASITTGRNGTYLNTGFSGSGCLANGGLILTWIILILIVLGVFAFSTTWGIIFAVIVVIVKIATRTKNEKINTENEQKNTSETELIIESSETPTKLYNSNSYSGKSVTRQYFATITPEVEKIVALFEQLCRDSNFIRIFKENTTLKITINGSDSNVKIMNYE